MMIPRVLVTILLAYAVSIDPTRVVSTAFAIAPPTSSCASSSSVGRFNRYPRHRRHRNNNNHNNNKHLPLAERRGRTMGGPSTNQVGRGGAATTAVAAAAVAPLDEGTARPPPKKRVRITALDGIRALLACHIVLGHFLRYANPPDFLLRFFAQVNVTVGAFFALSGYVTAYTTTEVGRRSASPRLTDTPSQKWWLSKVMAYYPMHWLVCLLFGPMFVYSDLTYGGWTAALANGALSLTLTQAWAPGHAETWNAPTWFLSSMTFSTALMPFALPKVAAMDRRALRNTMGWLAVVNLLPVLGYCYDGNVWGLVEGMTAPKRHPALDVFNYQRFLPIFNVAEVLMGVVACRLAMLDGDGDDDKEAKPVRTTWLSSTAPLAGLFAILALRATGAVPPVSDLLVRGALFTPLFLKFVVGAHRNTVNGVSDPVLTNLLSSRALVWLGGLSFPIYIVHGPLGQVFYKKLVATRLWGKVLFGPHYFALYLATVLVSAVLLNTFFLQSKAVGGWSQRRVDQFASWM